MSRSGVQAERRPSLAHPFAIDLPLEDDPSAPRWEADAGHTSLCHRFRVKAVEERPLTSDERAIPLI
jgi:hypothetical protein